MATVLVVDDEAPIADLLRDVLQDEGHDVLVAYNGREALMLAREYAPDIVLTDNMMPHMDGVDLARHLLADPPVSGMTLIMMSATRLPDLAELRTVTFIGKPFNIAAVVALIMSHT